jgi:hypothetical protein
MREIPADPARGAARGGCCRIRRRGTPRRKASQRR